MSTLASNTARCSTPLLALVMLVALCVVSDARAQRPQAGASRAEVEITYPKPNAEVGEPIVLTFDITNASEVGEPRPPSTPGLRSQVNRSREMSHTTIMNGRAVQRRTVRFDVYFIAEQPGQYELPRVRVVVDGETYESRESTVAVSAIDTNRMASVELLIDPEHAVVGQNVTATLRLSIRPPQRTRVMTDPRSLWAQVVLANESKWGVFQPAIEALYRDGQFTIPPRHERDERGDEWIVFELTTSFSPDKPGPMAIPGIEISLRYPRANNSQRLLTLEPAQPPVEIEPPPSEGRPVDYAGAVGVFEIEARAKPTRASVGDPITLSVIIVDRTPGGADLTRLLPPPISEQSNLQRDFRMPSEPLVGTVNGRTKVFTQSLRPLSERVTEIPPISFSFFDPISGKYSTVQSRPISITVLPAERIDTMVVTGGNAAALPAAPASKLTEVEGGLVASEPISPALLAVDRVHIGWSALAVVVAPPLIALVMALVRRRNERLGSDERIRRSRQAPARARKAIASAVDAPAIAAALQCFLADRCGLAASSLTRREALALLASVEADEHLCSDLGCVLAAGEHAAFANRDEAPPETLRAEAKRLLAQLERLDLSIANGVPS